MTDDWDEKQANLKSFFPWVLGQCCAQGEHNPSPTLRLIQWVLHMLLTESLGTLA